MYDSGSWSKVDLMETSLWLNDKAISISEQRAQVLNPFWDWLHFFLLLTRNAWPISLYMICRVVLYSTPDEITNIPDYTWIIGSFDSGVSLIMTLI